MVLIQQMVDEGSSAQEIHRFVSRRIGARTLERARYAGPRGWA
jgi:hypothetical protein